ncbi:MAG: UDP-N-acetylmuramoyl-L-alanyl-D-glutamate--2,6-diaminopimelate ligase [Candidatus Margulisiibacteriota bacterium]|nr:UDP-N-acetylmuramoyl-L-alanyl-D-glutamate--2,6-diaminopimelate ligase [Candidatus Margulisiibacteriota bacterium]
MKYTNITYDSRKVQADGIFVAISGEKYDGIDFVPQAIKNGAKLIVAEKEIKVPSGVGFKKVSSARKALAELSCEFYNNPSKKLKLVGITGTNGKTTTCYLIQSILEKAGYKVGLIGTINSLLTTPESSDLQRELAEMVGKGYTHCVMEVSSHGLAQGRVYGIHFSVAIFTNLTHDHLDFHKDMDSYRDAKLRLFNGLSNDAVAIINVDDPSSKYFMEVVPGEVITYGVGQAKHELRDTKHNEFDTKVSDVRIREDEMTLMVNSFKIRTPLIGMPNVYNIIAAYQTALVFNVPQPMIKKGIEALKSVPGRVEQVDCGQPFKVVVDFAHSPDALQKLIETFRPLTEGKIILVFGCPGDRDKDKRPVMGKIAAELADVVIVTTDDPHSENPKQIIQEITGKLATGKRVTGVVDRKTAIEKALEMAKKGDAVLIAGRGHEKFQDFAGKKVALDDVEVVRKFLAS